MEVCVMVEMLHLSILSKMAATSHIQLLSTGNVARTAKEWNLNIY